MLCRAWLPSVFISLLTTFPQPGHADETQPPSPALAQIGDTEFELQKRALEIQMADLCVKEAEISLRRIELQTELAQAAKDADARARLILDHEQAALHVEMGKLATQAARVEFERAKARLSRLREAAESTAETDRRLGKVYLEEVMDVLMPATEAVQEPKETEDSDPSIGPEQAATIERLLKQRRDTLRQVVELANAEYGAGRATQTDVVHATESLIEAELELTTDKAERIALREKRVESLRNLEQYTRAKQLVAVATSAELLAATAARLKAEIELLRERASDS